MDLRAGLACVALCALSCAGGASPGTPPDAGACDAAECAPPADAGGCTGDGEEFFAKQLDAGCCQGLTRIDGTLAVDGGCQPVPPDLFVCTRCGDGVCGPGESGCNCPADCP